MQETDLCDAATGCRFRVLSRWPRSAFEELLQVENLATGRRLFLRAMQSPREATRGGISELHREARAMASLEPACVLSVLGAGVLTDGRAYYLTESPPGLKGFQECKSRLNSRERRELFIECLRLLAVAEARGIALPLLSEANFQIIREGESTRLKAWPEPGRGPEGIWLDQGDAKLLERGTQAGLSSLARLLVDWLGRDSLSAAGWADWVGRAKGEGGRGFRSAEHARLAFVELDFQRPPEAAQRGATRAPVERLVRTSQTTERVPWVRVLLGFGLSFFVAAAIFRWFFG